MIKQHWLYGWMAGITIGFALWGSIPYPQKTAPAAVTWEQEEAPVVSAGGQQEESLRLHALSAVLMDGDSGRILYGKDADAVRPMASTTKIMTCIVALENGRPDQVCTVSQNAASQPKVHLGAPAGTEFYLEDLLYSLMLESHNDSAVVIAEAIAGSVEDFTKLMNQKARDLGCTNTHFVTPNGLDASDPEQHATTAGELALILRYCIRESPRREEFLKVTRTGNYSFADVAGKRSFSCVNHNALLQMMDGVLTGKTGFTGKAGYSYVSALQSEGRTYILALLGCGWPPHKTYKWEDARALFQYGKEHYAYRNVFRKQDFSPVKVEDGTLPEVPVAFESQEEELLVLLGEDEQVQVKTQIPDTLQAPVRKGQMIGSVRYEVGGKTIKSYPVCAKEPVALRDYAYCARQVLRCFFSVKKVRN